MNPFSMTALHEVIDGHTAVMLKVRTPGGEIPVHKANLDAVTAAIGGAPAAVTDVSVKPGLHGCEATFKVEGTGALTLGGTLDLVNPDGSSWATLSLSDATVRASTP